MRYGFLIIGYDQTLSNILKEHYINYDLHIINALDTDDIETIVSNNQIDLMFISETSNLTDINLQFEHFDSEFRYFPPFILLSESVGPLLEINIDSCKPLGIIEDPCNNLEDLFHVVSKVLKQLDLQRDVEKEGFLKEFYKSYPNDEKIFGGVIFCNRNLNCVFWNNYMYRLTGISYLEISGLKLPEKFDILKPAFISDKIKEALNGKESEVVVEFNFHQTNKSGWLNLQIKPMMDQHLDILGVLLFVSDISSIKNAEIQLFQNKQEFYDLFENAPIGYHEIDMDGKIIRVNRTESLMLGYSSEEMIGKYVWCFLEDYETSKTRTLAKLEQGVFSDEPYERIYLTKNGEKLYALLADRAIYSSDGRVAAIRTSLQNITERKKAELETERLKKHYQTIIEKSADGYVLINDAGRLIYLSPGAMRMFGYEEHDLEFMSPDILTHPDDREFVIESINQCLNDATYSPVLEYRFRHKNGNWLWIESRFSNLLLEQAVGALVINFRDINERKVAQEQLIIDEKRLECLIKLNNYNYPTVYDLLQATLQEVVDLTDSEFGFIYLKDSIENQSDCIYFNKTQQNDLNTRCNFDLLITEFYKDSLVSGISAFIDNKYNEHPKLRFSDLTQDVRKIIIVPVKQNNLIVAFLVLSNKSGDFDKADIRQLTLMLSSVWKIVEKKSFELKLNESEIKFRTVFESSLVGKSITSLDGTLSVNSAFAAILGYSVPELSEINWRKLTHPDDVKTNEEIIRKLFSGELSSYQWEKRYIHKSGKIIWVNIMTSIVSDSYSNPLYYITEIYDITDAKLASLRIKESEERYRIIAENSTDVIWKTDVEMNFTYVSPSVFSLLGYTVDEMYGKNFKDLVASDSLSTLQNDFRSVTETLVEKNTHKTQYAVYQQLCKTGLKIWTETTIGTLVNEQNILVGFVGVTRDITERKKTEMELQSNRDLLNQLFVENTRFLKMNVETIDYQAFIDQVVAMTGCKFGTLNLFEDDGKEFRTIAISGLSEALISVKKLLGYEIINKKWKYDPVRERLIAGNSFSKFNSLTDLTKSVISTSIVNMIVRMFNLGEVWILRIPGIDKPVGDFTLLFEKSQTLQNKDIIELFVTQIGIFIERVKSVNALQVSEEMYRNLVTRIPDGVYKSTHYGKFLEVNPAFVSMLGYDSKEELMNINILSDLYFKISDRDDNFVLLSDDTRSIFPLRKKDGSPVWVEDHGWYNMDEKGRVLSHEGVVRDITQRLKDEEQLRNREKKFRLLFEENPQPMFIFDLETFKILDVNVAAVNLYGYSRPDFLNLAIKDIRIEEEYSSFLDFIEKIKISSEKIKLQTKHRCKNGKIIDVEVYSTGIMLNDRRGRQVLVNDVTERLRAEQALLLSEANLSEALKLANMSFWEYDFDSDTFTFNDQFFLIYNILPDERRKYTMTMEEYTSEFIFIDELPVIENLFEEARKSINSSFLKTIDHRIICSEGTIKYVSVTVKSEYFPDVKKTKLVGATQDITERKLTEMMLEKSETFFRNSQQAAHIGSYVLDFGTGLWESSEILDKIFGIDDSYERTVFNWLEIVYEEDREMMDIYFKKEVVEQKKSFNKEYRIKRVSDGEIRWMHGLGELNVVNDTPKVMAGTILDITDRKLAEFELQNRMDELLRFQSITVGREIAMIELKKEVNSLLKQTGQPVKYKIVE